MKLFKLLKKEPSRRHPGEKRVKAYSPYLNSGCFAMLIFINFHSAYAQTPISLKASIDTALKNNRFIKHEKLKAEYQYALTKSGVDVPATNAGIEIGQINSAYNDTRFGLSQSIKFPTIYSKQKSVLNEEWKKQMLIVSVKEIELKRQVSQIFYTLLFLLEKERILLKNDTIYTEFLMKSELRFRNGESNLMEKTTAEIQQGQIRIQLNQIKSDIQIVKLQFQYYLNTTVSVIPYEDRFKLNFNNSYDSSLLTSHPTIKLLEQQQLLSISNTSLEKSKLLPDLMLAYSNMSMQGFGADNILYNTSTRFQSAQFGVAIPLFYGAQKAKIKASRVDEQIALNNIENGRITIRNNYEKAMLEYLKTYQTVNYYESTALKNAEIILETAKRQFESGEIDYLDFVIFTNHAIKLQNEYIDALKILNDCIIELAYYSNQ